MPDTQLDTPLKPARPGAFLVLDDEMMVAMRIEEQLYDLGVGAVVSFSDADAALGFATANPVAFALLDYRLGRGRTSAEIARLLIAEDVPFAFLSGLGRVQDLPAPLDTVPFLTKPVTTDVLRGHLLDAGCLARI